MGERAGGRPGRGRWCQGVTGPHSLEDPSRRLARSAGVVTDGPRVVSVGAAGVGPRPRDMYLQGDRKCNMCEGRRSRETPPPGRAIIIIVLR